MSLSGPIILIGFKGCGKSLIGKILAERLSLEFTDTDSLIENLYEKREGAKLSFRDIFKKHGKDFFRSLEKEALKAAVSEKGRIVSLGGGTLGERDTGDLDFKEAIIVHLTVEKNVLYDRIVKNGIPAFFDKDKPLEYFETLLSAREPVYKRYADITVDNSVKSPDEVVEDIIKSLDR